MKTAVHRIVSLIVVSAFLFLFGCSTPSTMSSLSLRSGDRIDCTKFVSEYTPEEFRVCKGNNE
jgi:hypothetical protein